MTKAKVLFFGGPVARVLTVFACLWFVPQEAGWVTAVLLALAFGQHFVLQASGVSATFQLIGQVSSYVRDHKDLKQRIQALEGR